MISRRVLTPKVMFAFGEFVNLGEDVMATVRFSEELRQCIISNARRVHTEIISKAEEAYPQDWGDRLYDLMFRDTKAAMNALPKGYFKAHDSLRIEGFGEDRDRTVEVKLSSERRWPNETPANESTGLRTGGRSFYNGVTLDPADDRWDDFKVEYNVFLNNYEAAVKQQVDFVGGVKQVLNSYSTLAPALKAWPALWDLIPTDKKDRHREIVEKRSRSAPTNEMGEAIDLNSLTAVVTADKLTRGGSDE